MYIIHTIHTYSVMKKEVLPFATTWMGFEGAILSEKKPDKRIESVPLKTNTVCSHLQMQF